MIKALPNLLVNLHTICIVDISGIDDSGTLERTFLATLWEHGYGRDMVSGHEFILSLKPFQKDWDYSNYLVMQESAAAFSLSTDQNTDSRQPSPSFKLCAESASGTFQMFVRISSAEAANGKVDEPDSLAVVDRLVLQELASLTSPESPPLFADAKSRHSSDTLHGAYFPTSSLFWEGRVSASKLQAITIVSRNDGSFLCRVYPKEVHTLVSLLNHIVQELQVIQYYFHPGRPTDLASAHKSAWNLWKDEKILDFIKYFENDIDLNGHLTLSANVYKAKLLLKQPIPVHSSDVRDISSIVGQNKLTHRIVKVYARRESNLACMVDLTGIEHPTAIRQRIAHVHNYLIRGQLLLTDKDVSNAISYEPLTDEQLFVLCFCGGNSKDILGIFAEVLKVVFSYEDCLQDDTKTKTIMSNISVKVTDWESGVVYGRVSFDGHLNFKPLRLLRPLDS